MEILKWPCVRQRAVGLDQSLGAGSIERTKVPSVLAPRPHSNISTHPKGVIEIHCPSLLTHRGLSPFSPFFKAQAMCRAIAMGVGSLDQSLLHDSWETGEGPCAHTAGWQCPRTYHPPRLQPSDSSLSPHRLQCACQHNTCGGSCDQCCPGFNQQPWKPATTDSANECQCAYTTLVFAALRPWLTEYIPGDLGLWKAC